MTKYPILLCLIFWGGVSFAKGGVDGGGGIGVRCPSVGSEPQTLELLDLHEGRLRGEVYPHAPQSRDQAVELTAELISQHFWNPDTIALPEYKRRLIQDLIAPLFNGSSIVWDRDTGETVDVEFGMSLPLSDDIGAFHIAPHCHLDQIAYFDDDENVVKIDLMNWFRLSWLHRSALVAHEMIYFLDRRSGLENFGTPDDRLTSERSRSFISALFSESGLTRKSEGLPLDRLSTCNDIGSSPDTTYAYVFDDSGSLTFTFNIVHGRTSPFQIRASFRGMSVSDLSAHAEEYDVSAPLLFADEPDAPIFRLLISKAQNRNPMVQAQLLKDGTWHPVASSQTIECYH